VQDLKGVHIEIYWAHRKLCEVQCLKMYRLLQYTVLFYCHLWPDILYSDQGEWLNVARNGTNIDDVSLSDNWPLAEYS